MYLYIFKLKFKIIQSASHIELSSNTRFKYGIQPSTCLNYIYKIITSFCVHIFIQIIVNIIQFFLTINIENIPW